MRAHCLYLGTVLVILAIIGGASGDPIQAAQRLSSDKRLEQRVTVDRGRIYLGELLDDLTRQTNVPLAIDQHNRVASGIDLTAVLNQQPLGTVLTALETLLSHRFCQWEWQRSREVKGGYVLTAPTTLEGSAAAARTAVLQQWSRDLPTYLEIANLEEPERTARVKSRPDLYAPNGSRDYELLRRITPADVDNLLKGAALNLDRSKLSPAELDALRIGVVGDDAGLQGRAGFFVDWRPNAVAPVLMLRSGSYAVSTLGGPRWENPWLATNSPGWTLASDPEVEAFRRSRAHGDPAAGTSQSIKNLTDWAAKFARSTRTNLLLDRIGSVTTTGWQGRQPEQTVAALILHAGLMGKKVDEIQLLRDRTAPLQARRDLVSWDKIRSLRSVAERSDGYLPPAELEGLADLRPEQLERLAEEFPDASPVPLAEWRPIFRFFDNLLPALQKRVTGTEGIPWREAGLVSRACIAQVPDTRGLRGLKLLEENYLTAKVSFRFERVPDALPPMPFTEPTATSPIKAAPRRAVWEVTVPGQVVHRVFPSRPREPLVPK